MEIFGVNVTQSNLTIFLGLLGSLCIGLVLLYWRLRTFWFDQEQKFIAHVAKAMSEANAVQTSEVQARLDTQTSQLESCIHRTPGHPENTSNSNGNSTNS